MPMVHGPSGSTSPMASTSTNVHHDQLTAHYHQYNAYDTSREAPSTSSPVASSSRNAMPHQQPLRQLNVNGRGWSTDQQQQQSATTPIASSSMLSPSAASSPHSPHYTNSDRSLSNLGGPSTGNLSLRTSSSTPSSSLAPPPLGPSSMPTTAASLMREGPRDFTVIKDVGDGSFGTVCLADWRSPLPSGTLLSPMQHPTTRPEYLGKRLVAIKKMKKPFPNWEECIKLKELKCLLAIPHHPNIIPLYDAFLMPTSKELHFVFECMEGNLYQLTKSRRGRPLASGLVASIFQQIVKGLHHIHQEGYFHRDMKPENLLITTTGLADYPSSATVPVAGPPEKDVLVIVKLADFGLARETNSQPPYTEYVSTRWYRAPEVLLRSRDYSNPVDMWALGTILAELVNLKPLFPGQSEVDQVMQICEILGDPSSEYGRDVHGRQRGGGSWSRGLKMASSVGFSFPKVEPVAFSSLFNPKVPVSLIDCIQDLLRYEPNARLTTQDCLDHAYYQKVAPRLQPPQARAVVAATTLEEQAILGKSSAKAALVNSFGSVMDQRAQRSALPPSHSLMPQSSKPAFGQATAHLSHDADVPMETASPTGEREGDSGVTRWAPAPVSARESSFSQYPAFPVSPSVYAVSQLDNHSPQSPDDGSKLDPHLFTAAQRRGQDDDLEMKQGQNEYIRRGMQQQQHPSYTTLNYDHANPMYRTGRPENQSVPSFLAESSLSGETETSGPSPVTLSPKERERRKSKGWISSVLGGNSSSSLQASQSRRPSELGLHQVNAASSVELSSTPAQILAAEHMNRSPAPLVDTKKAPVDAKKAKKLAEKAAREAEKAKRAAQEKAARERARAVMQKRDQILADSNSRDQVEWLNLADSDMTKAVQAPVLLNPSLHLLPSEVARGKQPSMTQNSGQSFSPDQSGHQSAIGTIPEYIDQSNGVNDSTWQSQRASPRGKVRRRDLEEDGTATHRSYFAGAHLAREDPRRQSIQSFQTGDSDPGPNRSLVPGSGMHLLQHHESSTSLNSAPGHMDGTSSSRTRFGDRNSFDTRSIASSLDNQLIQNMENMTAAESGGRRRGGSTSPGPVHLVGPRPSYSRQSHGSRTSSAHRQGSASPLHHQAPPRFHPYSTAINGNISQQPTSANSSYGFNLPSLASITQNSGNADFVESLHSGSGGLGARPRSLPRRSSQSAHRGTPSRGSSMASGDGPLSRHLPGPIHPMFHVPSSHGKVFSPQLNQQHPPLPPVPPAHLFDNNGAGLTLPTSQQPVLPPFSHIAAAASSSSSPNRGIGGDDFYTSASSPRHRSHSTSQQ